MTLTATSVAAAPEIGQLVEVRGRQWVVADSAPSSLPPDLLAGETARQHLLTLSSIEDDALGEELRVVWKAEVGKRIRHQTTLPEVTPDGFDDPNTLVAFLDAVRRGAVTGGAGHPPGPLLLRDSHRGVPAPSLWSEHLGSPA